MVLGTKYQVGGSGDLYLGTEGTVAFLVLCIVKSGFAAFEMITVG